MIARLNQIRREHPALQRHALAALSPHRQRHLICYSKQRGDDVVLVVVNLDPHHTHRAWLDLDLAALGLAAGRPFQVHDLLGERALSRGAARATSSSSSPTRCPRTSSTSGGSRAARTQFEYFL